LIITDYATNLLKIARWIEFLTSLVRKPSLSLLPFHHVPPERWPPAFSAILASKARTGLGGSQKAGGQVN